VTQGSLLKLPELSSDDLTKKISKGEQAVALARPLRLAAEAHRTGPTRRKVRIGSPPAWIGCCVSTNAAVRR
jgi:hypothetical protein